MAARPVPGREPHPAGRVRTRRDRRDSDPSCWAAWSSKSPSTPPFRATPICAGRCGRAGNRGCGSPSTTPAPATRRSSTWSNSSPTSSRSTVRSSRASPMTARGAVRSAHSSCWRWTSAPTSLPRGSERARTSRPSRISASMRRRATCWPVPPRIAGRWPAGRSPAGRCRASCVRAMPEPLVGGLGPR